MSKYKLVDIFESFKDSLPSEEKERFDTLTQDDQDKLEKIKIMMDKEKSMNETEAVDLAIERSQEKAGIKEQEEVEESQLDMFAFKASPKDNGNDVYFKFLFHFAKQMGIENLDSYSNATLDAKLTPTLKQKFKLNSTKYKDLARELIKKGLITLDKSVTETEEVEEVTSREGSRIEGLLNIPMKQKFLDAGMDLIQDLIEDDPFFIPDVIEHLSIELEKYYNSFLDQGEKLAGLEETEEIDEVESVEEGYEETKGKALYPILKAGANASGDEIEMYVKSLAKDIELNGKEQYKDFTSDDYVEDFKNYIADKGLQEHFGRFLKDYQ